MSEITIPVPEVARDFLRVLAQMESRREPATLMRDGQPVARLVPLPRSAASCAELAQRWESLPKLPPDEAGAFARDLEHSCATLPPLKSAWD